MTLYTRLRLSRGMRWQGKYPPMPWREIAIVSACCLVYGLVTHVDDLGNRAAQMEEAAAHNAHYKEAVIACLNGGGFGYMDTGKTFLCQATEI